MSADLLKKNPAILLRPSARLRDAAAAMTKTGLGIALAVDGRRKLLGVVTDIDIRRALLGKGSLDAPLSGAMNKKPVTAPVGGWRGGGSELFCCCSAARRTPTSPSWTTRAPSRAWPRSSTT
jgi:hypothetical protein